MLQLHSHSSRAERRIYETLSYKPWHSVLKNFLGFGTQYGSTPRRKIDCKLCRDVSRNGIDRDCTLLQDVLRRTDNLNVPALGSGPSLPPSSSSSCSTSCSCRLIGTHGLTGGVKCPIDVIGQCSGSHFILIKSGWKLCGGTRYDNATSRGSRIWIALGASNVQFKIVIVVVVIPTFLKRFNVVIGGVALVINR